MPPPTGCTWESWKPGDEQAPGEVDDLGARPDQLGHLAVPHGYDALAGDGHGRGPAA